MKEKIKERLEQVYQITNTNANSLAKLIHVPRGTMYNLDSGKTSNPTMEFLINLEKYAGIDMRWFSTGQGSPHVEVKALNPEWETEKAEMQAEISKLKSKLIENVEFFQNLYSKKEMANFKNLITETSIVKYLEDKVIEFKPVTGTKVLDLLTGYTSGDEVASAI